LPFQLSFPISQDVKCALIIKAMGSHATAVERPAEAGERFAQTSQIRPGNLVICPLFACAEPRRSTGYRFSIETLCSVPGGDASMYAVQQDCFRCNFQV